MCSRSIFPVNETIENMENAENVNLIDIGTQVDFSSDDNDSDGQDTGRKGSESFICRYYSNDCSNVEIQVSRPKINMQKKKKVVIPDTNDHKTNKSGFYGYSSIREASELNDLAGVKLETFQVLLNIMKRKQVDDSIKIPSEDQLFIFLMKMRCGLTFTAMGVLLNLHRTTISKVFYDTLMYLAGACEKFIIWPSKETVQATMPIAFKNSYKDCRAIIDCTEFYVGQSKIEHQVKFYSNDKKRFRIKILVCCTPSGYISYVSHCYGARATNCQIASICGFLDLLEPGDQVLADKEFPQVKTQLVESGRGVLVVMPPFLHDTFSEEQVEETYKVARIHIERVIERIHAYKIVDKFTIDMLPYCDAIIFMCCVLVNLQSRILKDI